eukprot:749724-Hanusia_phi.AAC.2
MKEGGVTADPACFCLHLLARMLFLFLSCDLMEMRASLRMERRRRKRWSREEEEEEEWGGGGGRRRRRREGEEKKKEREEEEREAAGQMRNDGHTHDKNSSSKTAEELFREKAEELNDLTGQNDIHQNHLQEHQNAM